MKSKHDALPANQNQEKQDFRAKRLKGAISRNQFTQLPILNPPMTEQAVVPPPHVWNRIEKILDTQDRAKSVTNATNKCDVVHAPINGVSKSRALFVTTFGLSVVCLFFVLF